MRNPTHELLTKADIMKQYRIPKDMLDKAIRTGELRSIDGSVEFRTGSSTDGTKHYQWQVPKSRYYIPRHTVEAWIDARVKARRS